MPAPNPPSPGSRHAPPAPVLGALRGAALASLLSTLPVGCTLDDGERFGRAGARPGQLRIHVAEELGELDPPRAERSLERAVSTQLFATLLDTAGRPRLATSVTRSADDRTLTIHLSPAARFSDDTPLDADAVLWSWRRALLRSTGTRELAPFASIAHGAELAAGKLLQVAQATTGRGAPYTRLGEAPDDAPALPLAPGIAVRVVDTNERRPCCGGSVALRREPAAGDALGVLHVSDVGTVISERAVHGKRFLQVRSPSGASGWAEESLLTTHVSPASLLRVVDRGDGSAALRVGPEEEAPVREKLEDDATVEILGEAEGWLHAVDVKSGQMGFVPRRAVESLRGERQWMLVEVEGDGPAESRRGWVSLRDLAFNPAALGARALNAHTIEVECAAPVSEVLAALGHPALAPVPAHTVAAHGRAWTRPGNIVTTGPFTLGPSAPDRLVLLRSPASFEATRARLERVELITVRDPISALHLYRAGELDVLRSLPAPLAPLLARAADFAPSSEGGGMVAREVRGLSLEQLDLRDVEVVAP